MPGHEFGNRLEVDLDIETALRRLRSAFPGVCIWHGEYTGSLWALLPGRLVEARVAADLARRLQAELGCARPGRMTPASDRVSGGSRRSVRKLVRVWLRPLARLCWRAS
ncbi:hypothetical protein F8568_036510 [Actinomadura sp. LD22]|uniref:Uncharacterized protein n=1 Tax=Actinomadura physcomitrii TaxID=2650748 RepID=A0A6I4MHW1_9ACTN|nr:hypothetical protein [Actinomadura physcomitrii]MWA05768.1 hypothetical protein [Actinomadura physcomitrii]